jgi:hypothetical protein
MRILKIVLKIYLIGFGLFLFVQLLGNLRTLDDALWPTLWRAFKIAALWPYIAAGIIHLAWSLLFR